MEDFFEMAKKPELADIQISEIKMGHVGMHLIGVSPLIMHRFSAKARRELLYPSARKNLAERATTLKHNPIEEYQEAFYRNRQDTEPAAFHIPCGAFEAAIAQAALDIPGATKAQISRLTSVTSRQIGIYGIPFLSAEMVRDASISRTPDVRFRPVFPRWAAYLTIEYKIDPLNDVQILNLVAAAGQIVGIGDSRPEKGGGSLQGKCGRWRLANEGDPELTAILHEGRAPQMQAFENPVAIDEETEELIAWWSSEVERRRQKETGEVKPSRQKNLKAAA